MSWKNLFKNLAACSYNGCFFFGMHGLVCDGFNIDASLGTGANRSFVGKGVPSSVYSPRRGFICEGELRECPSRIEVSAIEIVVGGEV